MSAVGRWTGRLALALAALSAVAVGTGASHEAAGVAAAHLPTSLDALHAETAAIDATLAAEARARGLGDRPLVVLTWAAPMSADEATWSSRGRLELVRDASHYVRFDRPDVVIRAVRDVVARVRAGEGAG